MAAQPDWSLTCFPRVVSCRNKINKKPFMGSLCSHLNDQQSMLCPSSDTRNIQARAHPMASVPLVFVPRPPRPVSCLCNSPLVGSPLSSSPNLTPSSKCKALPGPLSSTAVFLSLASVRARVRLSVRGWVFPQQTSGH